MIIIHFDVLGKEWTLQVLKKKKYTKKLGADSVATTRGYKRRIDIHEKGIDTETIVHELTHAYFYELCFASCPTISADDLEEIYCELMAKYGRELLDLADLLMAELIKITGELSKPIVDPSLPPVHFASDKYIGFSPCGDKNKDADVTGRYSDITCEACKEALKKEMN